MDIKSFSEERDGKEYLYTIQNGVKVLIGGPFNSPEEANFASQQASRLLGESSLQDYKNLVGAISHAFATNNKRALEGYALAGSTEVTPNMVGKGHEGKVGEFEFKNMAIRVKPRYAHVPNIWNHEAEHGYYYNKGVKPGSKGLVSDALKGESVVDKRMDSDAHFMMYNRPIDETAIYQNPKVRFNETLRNYKKLPIPDMGPLDVGSPYMRFKAEPYRNAVEYPRKKKNLWDTNERSR